MPYSQVEEDEEELPPKPKEASAKKKASSQAKQMGWVQLLDPGCRLCSRFWVQQGLLWEPGAQPYRFAKAEKEGRDVVGTHTCLLIFFS